MTAGAAARHTGGMDDPADGSAPSDARHHPARPVRPASMLVAAGLSLTVALAFAGARLWLFFVLDLLLAASFGWLGVTAYLRQDRDT